MTQILIVDPISGVPSVLHVAGNRVKMVAPGAQFHCHCSNFKRRWSAFRDRFIFEAHLLQAGKHGCGFLYRPSTISPKDYKSWKSSPEKLRERHQEFLLATELRSTSLAKGDTPKEG